MRKAGGDPKKLAAAIKASGSEFKSVRGPFRFGHNNMPVQNYYAFEAVQAGGKLAIKHVATPLKEHVDAYGAQCPLK
jgi:branched-chain amino acid transport system substrate-binding protein